MFNSLILPETRLARSRIGPLYIIYRPKVLLNERKRTNEKTKVTHIV